MDPNWQEPADQFPDNDPWDEPYPIPNAPLAFTPSTAAYKYQCHLTGFTNPGADPLHTQPLPQPPASAVHHAPTLPTFPSPPPMSTEMQLIRQQSQIMLELVQAITAERAVERPTYSCTHSCC